MCHSRVCGWRPTVPAAGLRVEGASSVSAHLLVEFAVPVVVVTGIAGCWVLAALSGARHELLIRRAHARARRAHYAAIEAAEDNPSFSPDTIERSALLMFALAIQVWREGDDTVLDGRPDAALISAWARSRRPWVGPRIKAKRAPRLICFGWSIGAVTTKTV